MLLSFHNEVLEGEQYNYQGMLVVSTHVNIICYVIVIIMLTRPENVITDSF